jgi:hypothetical protein
MFTGQWDIQISLLSFSFMVSIPMILVWVILFLTGLTFILTQIQVSYITPTGQQLVTNVFGALFNWLVTGGKSLQ